MEYTMPKRHKTRGKINTEGKRPLCCYKHAHKNLKTGNMKQISHMAHLVVLKLRY